MDIDKQIYQVAAQLLAENKTPTVALIKARLPVKAPLAQVIKGLQVWQNNPNIASLAAPLEKQQIDQPIAITQANIKQLIIDAVAPLQQEIITLKADIKQLKDHLAK